MIVLLYFVRNFKFNVHFVEIFYAKIVTDFLFLIQQMVKHHYQLKEIHFWMKISIEYFTSSF